MKKIEWIVSDLDGTLLNDQKQVSKKNQKAIQWLFEHDIDFGIVSGRPTKTIYETLDSWHIKPYVRFIVGMNGAAFMDISTQEITYAPSLSLDVIQKILNHFKGWDVCFQILDEKIRYTDRSTASSIRYTTKCHEREVVTDLIEYSKNHRVLKLMIYCDPEIMEQVRNHTNTLKEDQFSAIQTDDCMLEFMSSDIHKGSGLLKAGKQLHLDLNTCLSLGDADNDVSMFDVTDYSFCVLNGTKLAKEKAKYILPHTNEEDIIDKIVRKYI
ncbi:Cof-type HAD-IIB family hydrolase [Faecalicoccus pleomorphus]|uniref:Cof-type HAD-IIB family hydrolase n=1 Tax=Faecalicoccus pleomorphus TaxID=1323 RepID=A0AAW6CWP5_9FIRM|nr:Cof-type HAD-IIB family hydrolase [Faecalicoccus pleomorphus]MDB7979804.1 Cof-type HAD-IIB family hydrolase [Faecalicoccus pleomorphus]MDB7982067.1 Cof-type HAD-IIB family hydrolase [Faecalicoccus pleomorphus]